MKKLGHSVSDTTVERILKLHGIDPQPKRKEGTGWRECLAAHWECLAAIDFTTVDVWTSTGLKTYYLLFVMELKSRRVQYPGCTTNPNEVWILDAVDAVVDDDGLLGGKSHPTILLMDRDSKFSKAFQNKLIANDVKPHMLPPRSPNMNAYMERFIGTYKRELIHRMIFFSSSMLNHATECFLEYYHKDRSPLRGEGEHGNQVAKFHRAHHDLVRDSVSIGINCITNHRVKTSAEFCDKTRIYSTHVRYWRKSPLSLKFMPLRAILRSPPGDLVRGSTAADNQGVNMRTGKV